MKNLTKRLLTLLFAALLLLSCTAAFSGCNANDPTKKTYSYEFYDNALRQFYKNNLNSIHNARNVSDNAQLTYYKFWGLSTTKAKDEFHYHIMMVYTSIQSDGTQRTIKVDWMLSGEYDAQYYYDLRDSLPVEALELDEQDTDNDLLLSFRADFTKLSEEDKARLCKIFFDSYVERYPEALELVSLEE